MEIAMLISAPSVQRPFGKGPIRHPLSTVLRRPQKPIEPTATAATSDARKIIEAVICHIDHVALDVCVVMSGINSLRSPERAVKADEILNFLPARDDKLAAMFLTLSELTDHVTPLATADHFSAALVDGHTALQKFVADEREIGPDHARVVNGVRLAVIWSEVCRTSLALLDESNLELRIQLPLVYRQNAAVLSSLLSGSLNGLSPCLNDQGQLSLPNLPQQRRWPRYAVLQSCNITYLNQTFEAFVIDASAGGLGLDGMPDLPRNSQIQVTLENGRTLCCSIAWSNGKRAGVKFPAPLPPSDPLLVG